MAASHGPRDDSVARRREDQCGCVLHRWRHGGQRLGHRAGQPQRGGSARTAQQPPPAAPAEGPDPQRPDQQRARGGQRHVGAPHAEHQARALGRHEPAHQAGRGQHRQQKAKALDGTQREQQRHVLRCATERAGRGQHRKAHQHAAPQAQRIGQCTEGDPGAHAGALHHRQQERRLQQRQAQRLLQRRDRRWQLARVQCSRHAGKDDHQRGSNLRGAFVGAAVVIGILRAAALRNSPWERPGGSCGA